MIKSSNLLLLYPFIFISFLIREGKKKKGKWRKVKARRDVTPASVSPKGEERVLPVTHLHLSASVSLD